MKAVLMKKPGDVLNVPCDWCDEPSHYSNERRPGSSIYIYACQAHKNLLDSVIAEFSKKRIGRVPKGRAA
jgi:hypothetical protein